MTWGCSLLQWPILSGEGVCEEEWLIFLCFGFGPFSKTC